VALTLAVGFAAATRRNAYQGLLYVAVASYTGMAGEGFIVDTDHWRHFFLMMSIIWGIYLAGRRVSASAVPETKKAPAQRLRRRGSNVAIA